MTLGSLSKRRSWVPYILAIAAVLVFASYLAQNWERFSSLLQLSSGLIIGLLFLSLGTGIANGLINRYLFNALKAPLSLGEATGLALANTLANQLPFSGGLIAKGVYLKQRYQLTYSAYISATMALYLFSLSISGLVGLFALAHLIYRSPSLRGVWTLFAAFFVMAALGLFLFIPIKAKHLPERWRVHFKTVLSGWQVLRNGPTATLGIGTAQIIGVLIIAARYWLAFQALSQEASMAQCLLFAAGTVLTQLVSITPGGLGIREGIVGAISAILGFDPGIAVVAVALDRLVATTVIIAGGVISTYFLSKKATLSSQELVSQMPVEDVKTP